jgi:hypothetical protein
MASSYSRRCRYCSRWISMRQMPAGQWVAFEGDSVHDCKRPPPRRMSSPQLRTPAASGEFEDFEISPGAGSPLISMPTPAPAPVAQAQQTPVTKKVSIKPSPSSTKREEFEDFHMPSSATRSDISISSRSPLPTQKNTSNISSRSAYASRSIQPSAQTSGQSRAAKLEGLQAVKVALYAIITIYVIIGAFHSVFFSLYISRAHCLAPKNMMVNVFCNTGMGFSHFVAVVGWPFYYR